MDDGSLFLIGWMVVTGCVLILAALGKLWGDL